jgi:hypothetical protein
MSFHRIAYNLKVTEARKQQRIRNLKHKWENEL